jgi:hypothetical protein
MTKKLIISENQLRKLTESIHATNVLMLKDFLDASYEPLDAVYKKGGEYYPDTMIKNKIDNEPIELSDLLDYLENKFKFSRAFIKQVINDWYFGRIGHDGQLTKNVSL